MTTVRGDLLRYREGVAWTAALIGVPAWIAHLVFLASMAQFTTTHPGWRWSLHVATAVTALITLAGIAVSFDLLRAANRAQPAARRIRRRRLARGVEPLSRRVRPARRDHQPGADPG
jgi:hypothetical protein